MFVNKVFNYHSNPVFKAITPKVNDVGMVERVFNYPHDNDTDWSVDFYPAIYDNSAKNGIKITSKEPYNQKLERNGVVIPEEDIKEKFGKFDFLLYQLHYKDETFADSGKKVQIGDKKYTYYDSEKTAPLVNGTGVLVMPRNEAIGYNYDTDGKIIYDAAKQKKSESIIRTYGNNGGGNLVGFEYYIPIHARDGKKVIVSTPFNDKTSNHGYWIENLMQPASNLGNRDNIRHINEKMFQFGMKRVIDCAYTSEGLHGVHFDRAINTTTSGMKPLEHYMFLIDNSPVTLGVIPKDNENIRFKMINPPVIWHEDTQSYETNPKYDSKKPTIINTYDSSQISDEQKQNIESIIYSHEGQPNNPLEGNTYKNSAACGVFNVNPDEYIHRLDALKEYNAKNPQNKISVDSADGARFIAQFSTFSLANTGSGLSTWEAMNDIIKRLYATSPFLESMIATSNNPNAERAKYQIGIIMNQDINLQHLQMEYRQHKNDSILYIAKALQNETTAQNISDKLINYSIPEEDKADDILTKAKPLPKEVEMSQNEIDNVLSGMYFNNSVLPASKDDMTLYALMQMSLGELELGNNTTALLSSPFFTNFATSDKTLGKTRYELMKQNNPQFNVDEFCKDLIEPYAKNYKNMELIYKNEIKTFADSVIDAVNKTSNEKLLDNDGNYTEFGEYVIQLFAEDIMRYAMLKALCKDKLKPELNSDNTIKYNYDLIRDNTNLEAFGIHTDDGTVQAKNLLDKLKTGLKALNTDDVSILSESIAKRLEGITLNGLKIATAMYNKAGLSHDIRLDAAKDVVSWNEVSDGTMNRRLAIEQIIKIYSDMVASVKKYNPYANIIAEFTDMDEAEVSDILNKTKINSVAAYSYFFTELMKVFSADFEQGSRLKDTAYKSAYNKLEDVIKNVDAAKDLYTFVDNHDKPSVIHGYALNMERFYGDFNDNYNRRLYALLNYNADNINDLPIEARLNIDNPNFYINASTKQLAMLGFIKEILDDELKDTLKDDDKKYLNQALSDLMKVNYLDETKGETSLQTTEIPELATISAAVTAILAIAQSKGLNLTSDEQQKLIQHIEGKVKYDDDDFVEYHYVENIQKEKYATMLGEFNLNSSDVQKYNPYVIGLMHLIYEGASEILTAERINILKSAEAELINKYNAASTESPHFVPNTELEMMKTSLACKDFRTVITMLLKQAQYIAKTENNENADILDEEHSKEIFYNMFRAMTEPAVQKSLMTMAYLEALPGMPTITSRDMLCGLGFETPSKNLYQANRGTTTWSELDDNVFGEFENKDFKEYIKKIYSQFQKVTKMRSHNGTEAMNNGTPYLLPEQSEGILASMMYNGMNNFVINLFNTSGMDTESRHNYGTEQQNGWDSINPNNKYVPKQCVKELSGIDVGLIQIPEKTELINPLDNTAFIVKIIDGVRKIVDKEGKQIVFNNTTAPYGVMTLVKKTTEKAVVFKGKNINKQYHFSTNLYTKNDLPQEGTKLCIYSK